MVDARLPSRWLFDMRFEALSDRAFRTFCASLMWSNEQGTDGVLPAPAMRFFHPLGVDDATRKELADAGLWRTARDGSATMPDWSTSMGQSTAESIERQRASERDRKRRERSRNSPSSRGPVTPDVTPDVTPESLRLGEARLGEAEGGVKPPVKTQVDKGGLTNARASETDNPPPRYCRRHIDRPTELPCGPCKDARLRYEAWERATKPSKDAQITDVLEIGRRMQAEYDRKAIGS